MARTTFTFRLQRLLDVRIMREKQAQHELQVRRQQVIAEEQRLVEMQADELRLREEQKAPFGRGDDLYQFQMRRHFLEVSIKENVQEQTTQVGRIDQAKHAVVEQQDVVKQCGIDVKALEKLQEKQREEHRLEQLREEGMFLDDLAGQGFLRRRALTTRIRAEEHAADEAALASAPPPPASAPRPPIRPSSTEAAS